MAHLLRQERDGSSSPSMTGRTLGEYLLADLLGRGGMAEVYLAWDGHADHAVAVKVLSSSLASDPAYLDRFRREASAVRSLSHPNIVQVYDIGQEGEVHYLVMEYVEGESLAQVLYREGRLSLPRAMEIARDVCAGLDAAHRAGIVHRDIKPGNILLGKDGAAKIADFGLVKELADGTNPITGSGIVGTSEYLSPEQIEGKRVDGRADLYALGIVLYQMLTGRLPFIGDTTVSTLYRHLNEAPTPPRELDPRIPIQIERVLLKLLGKQPDTRYATAGELHAELLDATEGTVLLSREGPEPFVPRLVGREQELGGLKDRLRRAMDGEGGGVLVAGEAGIGKTRLVEELHAYAREGNVAFFLGRCLDPPAGEPYHPFAQMLRHAAGIEPTDARQVVLRKLHTFLQESVPALLEEESTLSQSLLPPAETSRDRTAEEVEGRRGYLFWCVSQLWAHLSRRRPLCLFADDLHRADEGFACADLLPSSAHPRFPYPPPCRAPGRGDAARAPRHDPAMGG